MDPLSSLTPKSVGRLEALLAIVEETSPTTAIVGQLGFLSRDLYSVTEHCRQRCLYCMGSMGSVIPLALGLTAGHSSIRALALEGDGSLLMNLGTLVSVRRYGSRRIGIVIFDNHCYESTGGQPSQPDGLAVEDLCIGAGLTTSVADSIEAVREWMKVGWPSASTASVLVIKSKPASSAERIVEASAAMGARFRAWLQSIPGTLEP